MLRAKLRYLQKHSTAKLDEGGHLTSESPASPVRPESSGPSWPRRRARHVLAMGRLRAVPQRLSWRAIDKERSLQAIAPVYAIDFIARLLRRLWPKRASAFLRVHGHHPVKRQLLLPLPSAEAEPERPRSKTFTAASLKRAYLKKHSIGRSCAPHPSPLAAAKDINSTLLILQ